MTRKRLADDVRLDVDFHDETPFGAALGGGADLSIRRACAEIAPLSAPADMNALVRSSKELLTRAFERDLASRYLRPEVLREECLYPPADRVFPRALLASRGDETLAAIGVERRALGELAPWISELQRGTERPTSTVGRALFELLDGSGALIEDDGAPPEPVPAADVVFVGHATVMIGRSSEDRVLVDPFLLPTSPSYPETYQPFSVAELLPAAAVVITHSHPDHFDPGSLLRLGADLPIYVPHVERESLLAVDMAMRLEQLGFSRVTRVRPGDEISVGQTKVHALPFFGEQPTTGECLHPEVRNVGCTYSFTSPERHVFLVADAGRDRDGDVRDLAAVVRRQFGAPDVLLGGYRGFALYPIQWLFSSVARYLLFVPESERAVRQVTMNDCDALLDTGERSGARLVVPYADGGAPWYWERGLGPRLDGRGTPNPSADPPPAEVLRTAARRSSWGEEAIGSPARVSIVRPGECLHIHAAGAVRKEPYLGRLWPYARPVWHQENVALKRNDGSALPSARAVFRALEPLVAAWREEGRLERFFFMRKPPDLRLRFFGAEGLRDEVSAVLQRLVKSGDIEASFSSEYEPETDRFGGPKAMDAVHAWFDVDTSAWARLDALESSAAASVPGPLLTCAVARDLVARLLPDRAEAWAMWRAYASTNGLSQEEAGGTLLTPVDIEMLESAAGPDVRQVLERYREANGILAARLTGLWADGELSAGMRSVVVALVMFHLNRYGLDVAGHARLAWSNIHWLDAPMPA